MFELRTLLSSTFHSASNEEKLPVYAIHCIRRSISTPRMPMPLPYSFSWRLKRTNIRPHARLHCGLLTTISKKTTSGRRQGVREVPTANPPWRISKKTHRPASPEHIRERATQLVVKLLRTTTLDTTLARTSTQSRRGLARLLARRVGSTRRWSLGYSRHRICARKELQREVHFRNTTAEAVVVARDARIKLQQGAIPLCQRQNHERRLKTVSHSLRPLFFKVK